MSRRLQIQGLPKLFKTSQDTQDLQFYPQYCPYSIKSSVPTHFTYKMPLESMNFLPATLLPDWVSLPHLTLTGLLWQPPDWLFPSNLLSIVYKSEWSFSMINLITPTSCLRCEWLPLPDGVQKPTHTFVTYDLALSLPFQPHLPLATFPVLCMQEMVKGCFASISQGKSHAEPGHQCSVFSLLSLPLSLLSNNVLSHFGFFFVDLRSCKPCYMVLFNVLSTLNSFFLWY